MIKSETQGDIAKKLKEIDTLFSRGVESFIDPDNSFKEKIIAKVRGEYDKDIVIKLGVDPTKPDIHIGHAVLLKKLRKFQELGCKVIFLIGDFTAQIGDPTGKSKVRPDIDQEEVERNMQTYLEQIGKILLLDEQVFSWIRNSDWFLSPEDLSAPENAVTKLNIRNTQGGGGEVTMPTNSFVGKAIHFEGTRMQKTHLNKAEIFSITLRSFLWTLKHITHARLIERDMFQDRLSSGSQLYMHEMMYPVLQGVDSYVLNLVYGSCDLEIGGTDQTFNMLVGRDVMKVNGQEQQAVLSVRLIEGTDGSQKMSKSLDNYIGITDEPKDMYGKVMSIKDTSIFNYFELAGVTPLEEIRDIEQKYKKGTMNPRDIKMRLAREIVSIYHGEVSAEEAETFFISTFQKKNIPDEMPTVQVAEGSLLVDILMQQGSVPSKSAFRRFVDAGSLRNLDTDEKVTSYEYAPKDGERFKVGKKLFLRVTFDTN